MLYYFDTLFSYKVKKNHKLFPFNIFSIFFLITTSVSLEEVPHWVITLPFFIRGQAMLDSRHEQIRRLPFKYQLSTTSKYFSHSLSSEI